MIIHRFCAVFLFAFFASLEPLTAQEPLPNPQPQLRIEAGMHTANIRRIDVTSDGKLLVTGSDDKTVRLWSLPEGKLVRTFRVPIAPENGGKINAVAISPDGRLIAAGGWDAYWQGAGPTAMYIYLFDTVTGAVRRLGPLPGLIFDVAFSPDGKRLAAGLSGDAGIRVWASPFEGEPVADLAYDNLVFGVDFDPSNANRLVTISDDGLIRLYDGDFTHPVKQVRIERDDRPNAIDISPDGKTLALAYVRLSKVDLLRMPDLERIGETDTAVVERDSLGALSWSADGGSLYAGGSFYKDGVIPMVRWPEGGRGKPQLFGLARSTIFDVAALRDGGVAAGSADPAIAIYGNDNNPVVYRGPVTVDMRNKIGGSFTIAPDGSAVRFGAGVGGREPWLFDIASLSFVPAPDEPGGFLLPRIEAEGLNVENWNDSLAPSVNGQPLPLQMDDASYSLAIAPDAQSFVLGTGFGLYRFDRSGAEIWRKRPEGETWGLNLTADGAVIVAAIGDGTIRWYNAETREELLTLFVHAPDKRWIAWTHSGYYAASAGGEDLIGWHVNGRSWDAPVDFFPASLFRNRFYRPDIVQMVLKTKDEARAVEQANLIAKRKAEEEGIDKNLPPVVEIIADPRGLETSRPDLTLRYRLRSPSGQPLSRLEVRIDGRPADSKGMEVVDESLALDTDNSILVRVPPQDSQVSLIAYIGDQPSAAATVSVKWTGERPEDKPRPKLTALLVGVSGYKVPNMAPLDYADDDAMDLDRLLKAQEGRIFSRVETRLLINEQATKDNILDGLTWLDQNTGKGDYALLLMSGHGVTDLRQKFYFLPIDANIAPEKLRTTTVTESEIKDVLSSIRGNVVFFVDACRSGASLDGLTRADATSLVNGLSRDDAGIVMFASSSASEDSLESPVWKNGAFTEALLSGLAGKANYVPDGAVDTAELQLFLPRDVKTLTDGRQTAIYRKPDLNEDFALAAVP